MPSKKEKKREGEEATRKSLKHKNIKSFSCLVPVQRLARPSRSMHFGDVSETNGHVTQNALAERNNVT